MPNCKSAIVLRSELKPIRCRYYDQLVAIENKIIISATQNPVVFKWQDAFDKGGLFFSKVGFYWSHKGNERPHKLSGNGGGILPSMGRCIAEVKLGILCPKNTKKILFLRYSSTSY